MKKIKLLALAFFSVGLIGVTNAQVDSSKSKQDPPVKWQRNEKDKTPMDHKPSEQIEKQDTSKMYQQPAENRKDKKDQYEDQDGLKDD